MIAETCLSALSPSSFKYLDMEGRGGVLHRSVITRVNHPNLISPSRQLYNEHDIKLSLGVFTELGDLNLCPEVWITPAT